MLRLLDGCRVKDKRKIKEMQERFDLLSINQPLAQIKIQEILKVSRKPKYPINLLKKRTSNEEETNRNVRESTRRDMQEGGKTKLSESCPST